MFSQGFWIGAGNLKAIAFFGALFPQFIDATQPLLPQILVLGITVVIFDYTAVMVYATATATSLHGSPAMAAAAPLTALAGLF
jgi:threonine/homoserine/homoserine lactone efflux protein